MGYLRTTGMLLLLFLQLVLSRTNALSSLSTSATTSRSMPPPLSKMKPEQHALAVEAMDYFDRSTDPFHAVHSSVELLQAAGFVALNDPQKVTPGGKYYYTVNRSTLVAFSVGDHIQQAPPFCIIGGHTDSPNLRVKPRSKRRAADCVQIGVECYGGGLWHTWFDRDLGVSGRVMVRPRPEENRIEQRLVQISRSLLRISNLAIHLQTAKEREAFTVNKEDHLSPILAMEVKKALNSKNQKSEDSGASEKDDGWSGHQEPALLEVLAHTMAVNISDIVDFELSLFDLQPAAMGGAYAEFLHSSRLDNLASCFMAVKALADAETLDDESISMIVLYDHEEVGSTSAVGAASPILQQAMSRLCQDLALDKTACIANSFVLSSDQAHALHPNYSSKHEKAHQPKMNGGMVIKRNANQRYATNSITGLIIREIARQASLTVPQEFIVRQDCGCGSTIGPTISAATGIRTIDMGCPQLSMHSIRETMGIADLSNGLDLFKAYFQYFRQVDQSIEQ